MSNTLFCVRRLRLACTFACATLVAGAPSPVLSKPPARKAKARVAKKPARMAANIPAVFYDEKWQYRVATLYGKEKNIVAGISDSAKFDRDGKFRQDYYIGNFYKGTYKINGDKLTTFGEDGKKIFAFTFTVGAAPKVLVLRLMNEDGTPNIDYSLAPSEKKP